MLLNNRSTCLIPTLIWVLTLSQPTHAKPVAPEVLESWVPIVNEFTDRRRNNSLFTNLQAPHQGFQVSYVHSSSGNLTFARRDLVRSSAIPLAATRIYDSNAQAGEFGPGWRLSWAEQLLQDAPSRLRYIDETGSTHRITLGDDAISMSADLSLRVASIQRLARGGYALHLRDGWIKRFGRVGHRHVLVEIQDAQGHLARFNYDAYGQLESVSDAQGDAQVTLKRDADGQVVELRDDLGRSVTFQYGPGGLLASATDLGGSKWRYAYNAQRKLVSLEDPAGSIAVSARYAESGRVIEVVSRGRVTRFTYDGLKTRVERTDSFSLFEHDATGYVTEGHASNGNSFRVHRNSAGRVTGIDVISGVGEKRERPAGSSRYSEINLSVQHDERGRITAISQIGPGPEEVVTHLTYDGETLTQRSTHGEDALFRNTESGFELKGVDADLGPYQLQRDFSSGVTQLTRPSGSWRIIHADNGTFDQVDLNGSPLLKMGYGADDRLSELQVGSDSAKYEYDAAGLRRGSEWRSGFLQNFDYDPAANLSRATSQIGTWRRHLNLDLDEQNRVTSLSMNGQTVGTAYDVSGNLVRLSGDRLGRIDFGFDRKNRLATLDRNGVRVSTYPYEPFESDLRTAGDDRTDRLAVRSARATHTFGSYEEVYLSRNEETWEWFHYDDSQKLIKLADVLTPADEQERFAALLRRLSLGPHDSISARTFDKPSSPLFLPPEWHSVNCTVCEVEPLIWIPGVAGKGPNDPPFNGCFPTINTVSRPMSITESGFGTASVPNGPGQPVTVIPYNEQVTETYVLTSVFANQELVLEQLSLGETTFLVFGNLPNTPSLTGLALYDASHEYQGDGGGRIETTLSLQHIGGNPGQTFSALSTGHVVSVRQRPHFATSTTDLMAFPTPAGLAVAGLLFNSISVGL